MAATTLPLIPSTVVGSHGRAGWWHLGVKAWEAGEMGPADLDEMLDDAADTAIRDMERAGRRPHHRRRGAAPRRLRRLVLRGHQGHPADPGAAEARPLGLRPADALRGRRPDRDTGRGPRHRQGVRVSQGPHDAGDQGDLRRAPHVRLPHPPRRDLQGRRPGRGALRGGHQPGAQGRWSPPGPSSSRSTSRPAAT